MADSPISLWTAWIEAVRNGQPISAKCHADALLDIMDQSGREPDWNAREKAGFFNWCTREGLIPRKKK